MQTAKGCGRGARAFVFVALQSTLLPTVVVIPACAHTACLFFWEKIFVGEDEALSYQACRAGLVLVMSCSLRETKYLSP